MNRPLLILGLSVLISFSCTSANHASSDAVEPPEASQAQPEVHPQVAAILKSIVGKEDLPAEQVFKNIEIFKGVPAKRMLRVMDAGYSESLGVNCQHCHVEGEYASDEIRAKRAAREMAALVALINGQLGTMKHIDGDTPTPVNCSTCHRGELKPSNRRAGK